MSGVMLKRLYLHNFKSFWESEFEFGKLNCLIAPNNVGKSNLIEALKFLDDIIYQNSVVAISKVGMKRLRNYHYDEELTVIRADFIVKNRVLVGNELIDYDIILYFHYGFNFETNVANIDISITGKIKSIEIDRADLMQGLSTRIIGDFESHIERYGDYYDEVLQKKNYQSFDFKYNHISLRYEISTRYEKTEESIANLFALQIENKNETLNRAMNLTFIFNKNYLFSSHYFKADSMKRPEMTGMPLLMENGKNLPEFLETLDEEVFADISISLIGEVELVQGIHIEKGAVPKLIFEEEVNGKIYPVGIRDISDGTVHFVAIMSVIIGNKQAIGVMIEEPERHMHMKVLTYILDTMRDDDKQIFFTTHSMELLQQLKLDEIIFLYRDYDGDTQSKRAKDIYNIEKIMKIYKDDLVEMLKTGILDDLNLEEDI
ncbi:MAG: AAA family ATPase [Campylobacterota bacterium]|nr:AAA family ATPase [Campylobacterota bacterium]